MSTPRSSVGRYELRERLGAGGMGTVWHAWDPALQRDVAVKEVVLPDGMSPKDHDEARERTLREAQATARIRDNAVVTVHDVLEHEGSPWIVMELLSGYSLQQHLDRDGPMPVERVEEAARSLLGGLRAAHAVGVTHRDVKPANIMLTEDGRTVLTDFGIANVDGSTALTQTGVYIGSPEYMAPERFEGERALPASDLWSLGVTLYALLEGRSPFKRESITGIISAVLTAPMPPREPVPGRVDEVAAAPLRALIEALLNREVAARPSAAQAIELLDRAREERLRDGGTARVSGAAAGNGGVAGNGDGPGGVGAAGVAGGPGVVGGVSGPGDAGALGGPGGAGGAGVPGSVGVPGGAGGPGAAGVPGSGPVPGAVTGPHAPSGAHTSHAASGPHLAPAPSGPHTSYNAHPASGPQVPAAGTAPHVPSGPQNPYAPGGPGVAGGPGAPGGPRPPLPSYPAQTGPRVPGGPQTGGNPAPTGPHGPGGPQPGHYPGSGPGAGPGPAFGTGGSPAYAGHTGFGNRPAAPPAGPRPGSGPRPNGPVPVPPISPIGPPDPRAQIDKTTAARGFVRGVGHTGAPGAPAAPAPKLSFSVVAACAMLGLNALYLLVLALLSLGGSGSDTVFAGWGGPGLLALWGGVSAAAVVGLLLRSRVVYGLVVLMQIVVSVALIFTMFGVVVYAREDMPFYLLMLLFNVVVGALLLIPPRARAYFRLGAAFD
ncbi:MULTISPECIES: serine/threonine-protein kinase [unclassified Nocardiopsis]|uniref:serine/threonine-protein kinase n=1 Tax=Nocardiopsis TaxID=2013 RepID=UPI00387AFF21